MASVPPSPSASAPGSRPPGGRTGSGAWRSWTGSGGRWRRSTAASPTTTSRRRGPPGRSSGERAARRPPPLCARGLRRRGGSNPLPTAVPWHTPPAPGCPRPLSRYSGRPWAAVPVPTPPFTCPLTPSSAFVSHNRLWGTRVFRPPRPLFPGFKFASSLKLPLPVFQTWGPAEEGRDSQHCHIVSAQNDQAEAAITGWQCINTRSKVRSVLLAGNSFFSFIGSVGIGAFFLAHWVNPHLLSIYTWADGLQITRIILSCSVGFPEQNYFTRCLLKNPVNF